MNQKISRISSVVALFAIFAFVFTTGAYAEEKMSRTDEQDISAEGIENIRLLDFLFADLTYSGEDERDSFSVTFKRTVETDDEEEFEDILSGLDLDISTSGNTLIVRLRHPKDRRHFSFWRFLRRKEWRVTMDVKGPKHVNLDVDADFSEIRTDTTEGNLKVDSSFSKIVCRNHRGMLITDHTFGGFRGEDINGGFTVNSEFCDVKLELVRLSEDSRVDLDFGNVDINLPESTGAEFHIEKSFGDVDFQTSGSLSYEGEKGSLRTLNEGGIRVDLNVDFGNITVRDNRPEYTGDNATSERHDRQTVKKEELPLPKPVFNEGKVTSITVRGTSLLSREEVKQMLNISEDEYYTRDTISEEVTSLKDESRLISSASFRIDTDGNLFVRVHEVDPYDFDFDVDGSFSRVAGVGLGPRLTITSPIGPLSEVTGGTQYHWANREWTYNVRGEKQLFDKNRLVLGGTYRLDYESGMEWTIPARDAHLNAFLLGLETNNLYQVEGGTGFISQSLSDIFTVKAEYFEENYNSLKKNTNWSLFNRRHVKEGNPPLKKVGDSLPGIESEGRLAGMRYSISMQKKSPDMNAMLYLETEKAFEDRGDTLPAYTRYLGNFVYDVKLPYRHILKTRIAGGYSDDVLPDQKSFRLGGLNTLRGYGFGDVPGPPAGMDGFDYHGGGSRMFLVNIDYFTYGFNGDFRMIFFGDAGNVWLKGESTDVKDLKRDLGIGLAFDADFFGLVERDRDSFEDGFRINWAVPAGNVSHVSQWSVNFVRAY